KIGRGRASPKTLNTCPIAGRRESQIVHQAMGETSRDDGGFTRVSPLPTPRALARLRAALLEVASGGDTLLAAALAGFEEWRFLAPLCDSAWLAGARRDSLAARRLLARRLRVLGTRPVGFDAAAALPAGAPVHLRGTALTM